MSKLLTLQGCPACMGKALAGRKQRRSTMARYRTTWNPALGMYIRKRSSGRRRRRGLGELGDFGQMTSIRASFDSVKEVLLFGGLAAGGAFLTEHVWNLIGKSFTLKPTEKALAEIATGIGLGMIIARFTKKPKLGAAVAIGAVVKGGLELFGQFAGSTSGLGLYDVSRTGYEPHRTKMPFSSGIPQISRPGIVAQGADIPAWVAYPTPEHAYAY